MKAYRNHLLAIALLWLLSPFTAQAAICDADDDGDIDRNDVTQIALARNTPATGPDDPRDADGDGIITIRDARACMLQCTLSSCAIIDPPVEVANIDVSPDPLDFGEVLIGDSASLPLTVDNTGTATLSVSGIASSGAPFSVIPPVLFDIAAGGLARNVDIEFTPTAAGVFNGTVTINSNADNIDPVVIAVTGRGVEPQVNVPTIDVGPDPLDFGPVFAGSTANRQLTVANTGGAALNVASITGSGAPFSVFPPSSFSIADGAPARLVDVAFSPTAAGPFTGTITINSNADNTDPVVVLVSGVGVEPAPTLEPDIDTANSLAFGAVPEGGSVTRQQTITNTGDAPLVVSSAIIDNPAFTVAPVPGQSIPFTLDPGATQNLLVTFSPPAGLAGTSFVGTLSIDSNDPDESPRVVTLSGNAVEAVTLVNIPILGASVDDTINLGNCANVTGQVQFGAAGSSNTFVVTLTDQDGGQATTIPGAFSSPAAGGAVSFSGIDACGLDDGILKLSVNLGSFDPFTGTPAIKNSGALPPPVLDPVASASVAQTIEICGTSRESTTVKIEGGASTVSTSLDALTTNFCLDVPLRRNTENTLIATAIDNLATPPRPRASASPIQVTHVDPSSVIIAEATSRPLTIEETQQLVDNGVIDLDDPTNFNVSMFTIVLTIGAFPVTVSQPVAVPSTPGVSYGSSPGGGWSSSGGGGGFPGGGGGSVCTSGCSSIVVIKTPTGQVIPGVIIIDGRIKTLKEFFQVTIAIQNTSTDFDLTDMVANIVLPAGLSPVKAGPGTDVATINTGSALDTVNIGLIVPGQTGTGQFIIRGDGIGTHNVDVDFNGFLAGGGLAQPEPVSGSAGTSVQVFGPPTFDVTVRHPSRAGDNNDVLLNEIYDLIVEIENTSSRSALYTSLELFVGGQALLVDANDVPLPNSNQIVSFGTIPAGRAVQAAFRVQSLVQGEIIACQAIASENINLTVDTGPAGTDCNIANTYPANFEPLPVDQPPVVIGINPLNGQPNIPVTTSVFATLTPQSCNIVGDTFTNVVTALINPGDPSEGFQVISADLLQTGTFFLEELDTFGNPVRHIPTDLTVENPPAGGTTIAVLRLGLASPLTQFFLKPNTTYRATLVGGPGGIESCASSAAMVSGYSWTFSTEQTCGGIDAPIATMSAPPNGSIDRPLNQPIVLNFTNRMNPGSFGFVPGNLASSSISVYADAIDTGGEIDISTATAVPGSGVFSNLNRTLTYTPIGNLAEDTQVFIRLTDGLRDICGNPLQTPPSGVQLFDFTTIPPDTTAPPAPVVNPVPAFINSASVQVSGQAEAGSTVTVTGGSAVKTTTASAAGLFSVSVPVNLNAINDLSVQATDASGNASATVIVDNVGNPLTTVHDNIRPVVSTVSPANGAIDVARDIVITADFNEEIKPTTINNLNFKLEGSVIPGTLAPVGDTGFSFTPDNLLDFNKTYDISIRANGMRDLAGNGLSSAFVASFTTQNFPLPAVTSVTPDSGLQGLTFGVTFTGTNLSTASAVISDNPGISGTVDTATDTSVTATITIDALAATGATTLGLTTLGGSASVPFNVLQKPPLVANIVPDTGDQGATVAAQIQGAGLTDITSITIDGTGVVVNDLGTGNDFARNVEFVIDPLATPGLRNVTVTTPGGSDSDDFTVLVPVVPALTSVSPDNGVQGTTFSATFTGTDLAEVNAIVSADPEVTGSIVSVSDTSVVANITVSALATVGATTISVVAPSGASNTLPFTVNAALEQITLAPQTLNLQTLASGNMNVSISTPAGVGGTTITLASSDTTIATVPATATIPQGNSSTSFSVTTLSTAGTATISASAAGFDSDTSQVNVTARGMSLDLLSPFVGVGRSISANVVLDQPALSGGLVVNLASGNTAVATVPASVFIPQGETTAAFTINGLTVGTTPLTATASGYVIATENIIVTSSNVINFGVIPEMAPGESVSLPISLGQPAPAGGLTINFTTSNSAVALVSSSVFIPEGLQVPAANPQVTGVSLGTALITGTASGFAPDSRIATVTLAASFSPGNLSVFETQSSNITLVLSAPAPAGGLTFSLTSDDTGVATVPASVTVGEGQTSVQLPVSGVAVGSTTIRANSAGLAEATASITVNPLPGISVGNAFVGKDLQQALSGFLASPAPAGGVQVTMTSSDPAAVLLSTSRTATGSGSINFNISAGSSSFTIYVQSLTNTGTVTITTSAPGYSTDTSSATSAPSGFWINSSDFTVDVFAANRNVQIRSTRLNPGTLTRSSDQEIRGGHSVSVDLTNSDDSVGVLTGDPVVFNGGSGTAVNTAFDPLSAGSSTIAVVQPTGFDVPSNVNTSIVATVTAPNIIMGNATVGKDLQTGLFISLSNAPPSPVDVTVTIDDPGVALLSTSRTTAGSTSVTFSGVTSTSVGTVYVQGLTLGSAQVTVQAASYNDDTSTVTVNPSGFWINSGDFTLDVFSANRGIQIRSTRLNPGTLTRSSDQEIRGGHSVSVDLTNSDDSVGVLTVDPVVFNGGSGTAVNTAFDPLSAGSSTIAVMQPTGFDVPSNVNTSIVATVTAPNIIMGNATVGKDLQQAISVSFSNAPPSPVDVTLTIDDPGVALLSTDRNAAGSSSVTFSGVSSSFVGTIYVQGLAIGSAQITTQAASYNDDTSSVTVNPSGFWINSSDFTVDVFAANRNVQIRSTRLNPGTLTRSSDQEIRGGHSVSVDLTNSDDSVGVLTVDPVVFNGGSGTAVNTAFDPASGGATTIAVVQPTGFDVPSNVNTSIVATVTAPNIIMGNATVGKDLQAALFISLSNAPPSPVDVTVTIAASSVALLSSDRTAVGSSSVTFSGVSSTSVGTVYVQGLAIGSTQITVQAAGYNDDTSSVTVNPSGFWINSSNFTVDVFAANRNVQIRSTRLNPGTLTRSTDQEIRGGHSVSVDLTNSDDSVGVLTVDPVVFNGGSGTAVNTAFDPLTVGTSTIAVVQPFGFDVPSNVNTSIVATVTDPSISVGNPVVGQDLQQAISVSFSNAPPSPVDVTLTIDDPGVALLSPDRNAAGSSSVTFSGVSSSFVGTIYVQGLAIGSAQITTQAAGYNDDTSSVTVNPSGFWFNSNDFSVGVAAANRSIQVRSSRLTPGTLTRSSDQEVRGGHSVSVDLTNSDDSVGVLTVDPVVFNGGSGTAVNTAFDPLSVGASDIEIVQPSGFSAPTNVNTAITATVTP